MIPMKGYAMRRSIVAGLIAVALLLTGTAHRVAGQSGDPLVGRFGGTEDDFTEKYGRPTRTVDVDGLDDSSLLSYDVFGFDTVDAIVFDDAVVGLILRPIAGDTWSTQAAQTVINDFGPDDADYEVRESLGESASGFRVGRQGASDAIGDAIDDDTYDDLEFSGDPGDFFVTLYQAEATGFYAALSLTLGELGEDDAVALTADGGPVAQEDDPAPAADPEQGITAAEQAYFDAMLPITQTMEESLGTFGELFQNPRIGQDDWTLAVVVELFVWQESYQSALAIEAPPAFEGVHALLVEALRKFNEAADIIPYGIDNLDVATIDAAGVLVAEGGNDIAEATALLGSIAEERGL